MKIEDTYLEIIKTELEKQFFILKENSNVFIKSKLVNSDIGVNHNTNEIFIRCEFIERLIKKCLKEMLIKQNNDLNKIIEELN